jgi:dihydroorotate dehydrogenase
MLIHKLALNFIKYYPFDYSGHRTIIGLAAGFDKDCDVISHIHKFGFAFAEVGSLTPKENKGNKPNIRRFDHSMINNLGLPNIGIDKAIPKLQKANPKIPILINISPLSDSKFQDIQNCVSKIEKCTNCSAIVLNLFCPNIKCKTDKIDLIKVKSSKPIFIKLSPDLSYNQLSQIVTSAIEYNIKGYVLTNSMPVQNGGLSGRCIKDFSNASIRNINKLKTEEQIIIGCGGIETKEDILEKISLGADYVEILTSWLLSRNPLYINNLNKDLGDICQKIDLQKKKNYLTRLGNYSI